MPGPQPSWQAEPCPPWCIREHAEHDIALDRYHQGEATTLSILMSADPREPREDTFAPADVMIRIGRYAGESADWVAIETAAPRMTLTAESARRLTRHIAEQLDRHQT